jgi:hypothetical protein
MFCLPFSSVKASENTITTLEPSTEVFNKKVYLLIFNPRLANGKTLVEEKGWYNTDSIVQNAIDSFKRSSNGRLNYTITTRNEITDYWPMKEDGFTYDETSYNAALGGSPHDPDTIAYDNPYISGHNTGIFNDPTFDLCTKINNNEIDEVWIFGGPKFGIWESNSVRGPNAQEGFSINGKSYSKTTCNKLVPIMGGNYEAVPYNFVHNFGHRAEAIMVQQLGYRQAIKSDWDKYVINAGSIEYYQNQYYKAGCGTIHIPPNSTSDYMYDAHEPVQSYCQYFFENYPNISDISNNTTPISCEAWECNDLKYYEWWFNHLPNKTGKKSDGTLNDWWKYFVDPALANAKAKLAIYRNGTFYLKNGLYGGNANVTAAFGIATDIPVMCDWNGNGTKTVGVYRNGTFFLKNSNTGGNADITINFGITGDKPICGDWDGDGIDTIGVKRGNSYYLRNTNTSGNADISFLYGLDTDKPVVGDWNGDGKDTIGIVRNANWYLRNTNTSGNADLVVNYGSSTDVAVVGDWNNDGIDTIGIFRNGTWFLRNSNSSGIADSTVSYGTTNDIPFVWR